MSGTEKIDINGTQFRIFRRLPYRLGSKFQRLMLSAYADTDIPIGQIDELTVEELTAKEMNSVDLEKLQEAQEYLLKNAVLSPKITDEILDDFEHDLQDCIQPLIAKLMDYYSESQKKTIS